MLRGSSANEVAGFGCHGYGCEAEQGGGVLGYKGVQSPPTLCRVTWSRGSGQAGNRGRTNSRCWGQFILLGDPWA